MLTAYVLSFFVAVTLVVIEFGSHDPVAVCWLWTIGEMMVANPPEQQRKQTEGSWLQQCRECLRMVCEGFSRVSKQAKLRFR